MMKTTSFLFALLVIIFSTQQAMAVTDSPTDPSSSNLLNLTYFPHLGKFAAESTYSSQFRENSGSSNVSRSFLSVAGEYGILIDGLRVSASEGTGTVGYTGPSRYYSGVTDPTFLLNYRLIDSNPGGWSVDAELGGSPSLGTDEVATRGVPGSNYKGYGNLHLAAAAFWAMGINEAKLRGAIYREFSGNGDNPNSANSYDRSSHWFGNFGFSDRVHVGKDWFVEGTAAFDFASTSDLSFTSGATQSVHQPFEVSPSIEIGYLPTKQLLLTASMSYHNYDTVLQTGGFGPNNSNQEGTDWALSATLEF